MPKDGFEKQLFEIQTIQNSSSHHVHLNVIAFEPDMFTAFVSFCLH